MSQMQNEHPLPQPRVLFEVGMEAYEKRFEINANAIANTLVRRGIAAEQANEFDVVFRPRDSRFGLGYYSSNASDTTIETTSGESVTLRQRGVFASVHPEHIASKAMLRFMLLHETGHMYEELTSENDAPLSYYDGAFMQRMRRRGTIGIGAFLACAAGLPFIEMIDQDALRISLETLNVGTAMVGTFFGLYRLAPKGAIDWAWATEPEEWRAHAYALRNWRAPIISERKLPDPKSTP